MYLGKAFWLDNYKSVQIEKCLQNQNCILDRSSRIQISDGTRSRAVHGSSGTTADQLFESYVGTLETVLDSWCTRWRIWIGFSLRPDCIGSAGFDRLFVAWSPALHSGHTHESVRFVTGPKNAVLDQVWQLCISAQQGRELINSDKNFIFGWKALNAF